MPKQIRTVVDASFGHSRGYKVCGYTHQSAGDVRANLASLGADVEFGKPEHEDPAGIVGCWRNGHDRDEESIACGMDRPNASMSYPRIAMYEAARG